MVANSGSGRCLQWPLLLYDHFHCSLQWPLLLYDHFHRCLQWPLLLYDHAHRCLQWSLLLQVYCGEEGILSTVHPGTLMVDCSTIDTSVSQAMEIVSKEKKAIYMDAPVSGGRYIHWAASSKIYTYIFISIFRPGITRENKTSCRFRHVHRNTRIKGITWQSFR